MNSKWSLLLVLLCFFSSHSTFAQPYVDRPQDSNMKAGQLFTIRLVPQDKQIELFVAGNDTAKVKFEDVQVTATFKVGAKSWTVASKKTADRFLLERPPGLPAKSNPKLQLKLNERGKTETFEMNVVPH